MSLLPPFAAKPGIEILSCQRRFFNLKRSTLCLLLLYAGGQKRTSRVRRKCKAVLDLADQAVKADVLA